MGKLIKALINSGPVWMLIMTLVALNKIESIDTTNKIYMVLIIIGIYTYWNYNFFKKEPKQCLKCKRYDWNKEKE